MTYIKTNFCILTKASGIKNTTCESVLVPLPKSILEKLGKLIPRLGSNHPGEVLEKVRAKQNRHRKLADDYQAVADQFEIDDQPQSASRDIAVA